MIDPQGDPTAIALAHDEVLAVVAPDGVEAAISAVMARHEDELNVALRPYGVELRDLLQPAWMRIVRIGDVEAFRPIAEAAALAPQESGTKSDGEDLHST